VRLIAGGILALAALPQAGDWVASLRPMQGDCRVLQVIDGDTVMLDCAGEGAFRARLLGYDAPEVFSPSCASEALRGALATQKLRALVWGAETITVGLRGHDRYGRQLVDMVIDGESVSNMMIAAGLARPYAGAARQGWCG
jgi:endonuclease YncB( thermonuclease family)